MNADRARTRDRAFAIGLPPSLLAKLADWYPNMVCEYFTGQRELPAEFLARLRNTLEAAEKVAESSPTPVRWTRLDLVRPLVALYRREIEDRLVQECAAKSLVTVQTEGSDAAHNE